MEGKPLMQFMPERFGSRTATRSTGWPARAKRNLPVGAVLDMPGLHRNGTEIPLEISYGIFSKEGKYYFIGIVRDISERKRAEESIRRSNAILNQAGQMANLGAWEIEIDKRPRTCSQSASLVRPGVPDFRVQAG